MGVPETVLVIRVDGVATQLSWPAGDVERQVAIGLAVGSAHPRMRRCGKGILGFDAPEGAAAGELQNPFATAAFLEQGIELTGGLFGSVLFARNPSKGRVVKPLTAAQSANLLAVTGAHLG